MKHQTSDIKDIPFDRFYNDQVPLEDTAASLNLSLFSSWLLPQAVAYFATAKVTKMDNGLYDPRSLGSQLATAWGRGLFLACTKLRRSELVPKQVSTPQYSALVPLVLLAHKKYNNIKYSEWDREHLRHYLGPDLAAALDYKVPDLSRDRLLQLRVQGTTTRTGKSPGPKNPTSVYKLKNIRNTEIAEIPWLAGVMLTQIWVAHPSLRTADMILNPSNLDDMPPPLVSTEVFTSPSKSAPAKEPILMPWDL